jgi:hypothetical protein
MLSKQQRFELFLSALQSAPAVNSEVAALFLLAQTLNSIEDRYSEIPYNPVLWMSDGRMYPPQADSRRLTQNIVISRYRNRAHNTLIGNNGAIQIIDIRTGAILLNKLGANGQQIGDL